jgi:cysteinyl-tRNA synthetase
VTIHELLQGWPGEVLRFNMLRSHYRQPMDWTMHGMKESQRTLDKFSAQLGLGASNGSGYGLELPDGSGFGDPFSAGDGSGYGGGEASSSDVVDALSDDLNTPLAIAMVHTITNGFELLKSLKLLGIDLQAYAERREKKLLSTVDVAEIEAAIDARNAARKAKDFKESDRIRDELAAKGIVLKDGPSGTTWEVKR